MAFDEVENGEKLKQARIKKEREDAHNTELMKQKQVLEEQMKLFNNPESRDINPFLVDDNDIGAAMPDIEAVDSDATDDDEDNLDVEM